MSLMHTWVTSEKVPKISDQSDRGIQRYLIRRQRYIIVFSSFRFTQVICSCTPLALSVCVFSLCVFSLCVFSLYGDQLTFDQHCWSPTHCWSLLTNTVGHFPPEGLRHPRGICSRVFSFILCFLYWVLIVIIVWPYPQAFCLLRLCCPQPYPPDWVPLRPYPCFCFVLLLALLYSIIIFLFLLLK